ncbi:MAG: hypothetical protein JW833_16200 [Prolixibacteraceae bacterium]|nr:hypothetical protein [Prolixibacteraceae bacterium]
MDNNQKGNMAFPRGNESHPDNFRDAGYDIYVEKILAVIDIDADLPDGLIEKVMQRKESVKIDKPSGFDALKYLQIAAVLAAGIFIGILLGKNADVNTFRQKKSREDKALIELRNEHYLSDDYTFGRL